MKMRLFLTGMTGLVLTLGLITWLIDWLEGSKGLIALGLEG